MTSEVWSAVSEKYQCGDPASCTIDVIKYQSDHPGAKYGMKSAKFAARFGTDVLKEILKDAGVIALKAFSFVGAILGVIFSEPRSAPSESLHLCRIRGLGPLCLGTSDWVLVKRIQI